MSGNLEARLRRNRRLRVALTLIGLVLVALVPVAPANAATTISISRGSVIGGESINVTGKLGMKKARPVVLQKQVGSRWVNVTPSRSTKTGSFRFLYRPPTKAGTKTVVRVVAPRTKIAGKTYRQITTGGRSVLTVGQTATMTVPSVVSQDAAFTISGKFTPARTAREVIVQKPANGTWVQAGASRFQNSSGTVTFPMVLKAHGTFQFRVLALASDGAPAVASAPETVTVSLPVPTGLAATAGDTSAAISWNPVSATGLAGYHVYKRTDSSDFPAGWTKVNSDPVTGTSLNVSGLSNGVTHYFTVTSVDAEGDESAFAPKVSATPVAPPDTTPPPVPTGANASPGNQSAQVSWNAVSATDLAGYRVYRGSSATGPWTQISPNAVVGTTYNATSLTNGTEYFFAVTSVDDVGNESAKSTAASATPAPAADTTPPPVPGGVGATAGSGSAQVSWSGVVAGDLAGYKVYQGSSASGPWTSLTPDPIAPTTFAISGLTNNTEYFFSVTSLDTSGNESAKSTAASVTPTPPPAGWTAVSAGLQHTCAIASDSSLWCWGYNSDGQLGSNADITSPTPAKVGSSTWATVSAGADSTCGVQSNGTLWCWGSNKYGQLGNNTNSGTGTANPVPLQVAGTTWASVSVGFRFACATRTDATLWCWGYNGDGALGRAVGEDPLAANPTPGQVAGTTWTSVSAGTDHACALTSGGQVSCWGGNISGQLARTANAVPNLPATIDGSTWTSVSAGEYHTCGIQSGGAALCWGSNEYGELGKDANAVPNAVPSAAGSGWTSISAGGDHTCGTKSDGVYCFGRNQFGQLGKTANSTANAAATKVAASTSAWTSADSGGFSTCARTTANKVFCWGLNEFGQVGNPSTVGTDPNSNPYDVAVPS